MIETRQIGGAESLLWPVDRRRAGRAQQRITDVAGDPNRRDWWSNTADHPIDLPPAGWNRGEYNFTARRMEFHSECGQRTKSQIVCRAASNSEENCRRAELGCGPDQFTG